MKVEPTPTQSTNGASPHPSHTIESSHGYGVADWGRDLFDVADDGDIVMVPEDPSRKNLSLSQIVNRAKDFGIHLPLLVRFPEFIASRARRIRSGFETTIEEENYQNGYRMLFPVKANPQNGVLRTFLEANQGNPTGFEIGSKAELLGALHHLRGVKNSLIVCNGKKDEEFIRLALRATQIGIRTVLVSETPGEFDRVLRIANSLQVEPLLGIRSKMVNQSSDPDEYLASEESAPFGLSFPEIVAEVDFLKAQGKLDCLRLLHFHNAAQTKYRHHLWNSIIEVSRLYASLVEEGAPLGMLDIGGGIPVVGTGHPEPECHGHPVEWLPKVVIRSVMEILDSAGVPHPEIITEAGRAIVAPSTVLVFDVISRGETPRAVENPADDTNCKSLGSLAEDLALAYDGATTRSVLSDATYHHESLTRDFNAGLATLRERAKGERIFREILQCLAAGNPELRKELELLVSDVDYASLSIFRSVPDLWGLGEVFPVLPIAGLNQPAARKARIRDLTCDPDGIIDRFLWNGRKAATLPLPPTDSSVPMGIFLIGAYQEIIGSAHNLYGRTNVVDVYPSSTDPDGFELRKTVSGSTVSDMLARIDTSPSAVLDTFHHFVREALRSGNVTASQQSSIIEDIELSLSSYSYFQASHQPPEPAYQHTMVKPVAAA